MMRLLLSILCAVAAATAAAAQAPAADALAADFTLVAARPIRSGEIIREGDVRLEAGFTPGALSATAAAVGMEAKVTIYRDRAIGAQDVGPPALVERNQIVTMSYARGALHITAEGRALDRGGLGEKLRVMNLDSRTTVTAVVSGPGQVEVR